MQLVSEISNLCDYNQPTSQTDGQTDRETDRRHAIARHVTLFLDWVISLVNLSVHIVQLSSECTVLD